MNKFLTYALLLITGFLIGFFLKGCGDKKNETDPKNQDIKTATDTLKTVQDYPNLIKQKEVIIMDLEAAVAALEKQSKERGDLSAELASKIRQKNEEIKRLGGEIQALQFLVSTTKVTDTAPVFEVQNEQKEPVYYSIFRDSSEWYSATVVFDLVADQGSLNLLVREKYILTDYTKDGIEYFRVESENPHVSIESGSNLFKKPTPALPKPKKNLLAALYGRSTDGRELYSLLYGRRFLKHGKVFVQGVYDRKELSGLAGLGLSF